MLLETENTSQQEVVQRDRPLSPKERNLILRDYHNIGYRHTLKKWHLSKPALDSLIIANKQKKNSLEETMFQAVQTLKSKGYTSMEVSKMLNRPLAIINDLWSAPSMFT
jgi:hypothetical protein